MKQKEPHRLNLKYDANYIEIGTDEVGRGCCAGPVVAAAVILDSSFNYPKLRDSKKMSEKQRNEAYEYLTNAGHGVVDYSIGIVSPQDIDEMNILNASMKAMHLAIDGLQRFAFPWDSTKKDLLILADGNQFYQYRDVKHVCIVKGDDKYYPIAAAAVIAKVYRDKLMTDLSKDFPHYSWDTNKGYGTLAHLQGIADHGYTVHHRRSFSLTLPQKQIF